MEDEIRQANSYFVGVNIGALYLSARSGGLSMGQQMFFLREKWHSAQALVPDVPTGSAFLTEKHQLLTRESHVRD